MVAWSMYERGWIQESMTRGAWSLGLKGWESRWRYSFWFFFFFFKQKTAYGVRLSLVGSEMWIRDRFTAAILFIITLGQTITCTFQTSKRFIAIGRRETKDWSSH